MAESTRKITFGEVIGGALALVRSYPNPAIAYVAGLGLLNAGLTVARIDTFWPMMLAAFLGSFFLLEQIMLAHNLTESADRGQMFGSYLGLSLLASMASFFGLILFVIPGLLMMARWTIAAPLIFGGEASTITAMSRSWELTRGSQWPLMGFFALFFLGQFVVVAVLTNSISFGAAQVGLRAFGQEIGRVASGFIEQGMDAFSVYAAIAVYCRLLEPKESLGEVFA